MKSICLFLALIFLAGYANAQQYQWARSFGSTNVDGGEDVVTDASGNVYIVGEFDATVDFDPGPGVYNLTTAGSFDMYICKLDPNGNFLWAKRIGGSNVDYAQAILLDQSGNICISGAFYATVDFDPGAGVSNLTSSGNTDIFVLKLDPSGNFIWAKKMGGTAADYSYNIVTDASGNLCFSGIFTTVADFDPGAGVMNLTSNGSEDGFVAKVDANGNLLWAKALGGPNNDAIYDLAIDPVSGAVITTGFYTYTADLDPGPGTASFTSTGSNEIFLSKLDANGSFIWAKSMGGSGGDIGYGVTTDTLGNIYLSGAYGTNADMDPGTGVTILPFNGGNYDLFVAKLSSAGTLTWAKGAGGSSDDAAITLDVDATGNILSTGAFYNTVDFDPGTAIYNKTSAGGSDVFVLRLDPTNGNFISAGTFGGAGDDRCRQAFTASGNIYLTGGFSGTSDFDPGTGVASFTSNGNNDIFVSKLSLCAVTRTDSHTACSQYTWIDGNTYTSNNTTATYAVPGGTANGCDSIVTLNLALLNTSSVVAATACSSYTLNGHTYSASGTYTQQLTNAAGCDSTITVNLTLQNTSSSVTATACDNYTLNSQTYTNSGVYTQHLTNAAGCDSTLSLNLTILHASSGTASITACESYTWVNGTTYTASTSTPTVTLTNAAGCDSVVHLHLTIAHATSGTDVITSCGPYTWIDGTTYSASTFTPTMTLTSSAGCDSVVTLHLTIATATSGTATITACGSYIWIDGHTYAASTSTPTFTLTNAAGCDSVVTLDLTILAASSGTDVVTACDSYTWIDGITYTASTSTPTVTFTNPSGCDSVVTLNLTILPSPTVVADNVNGMLVASGGTSYQWINCESMSPIFVATSSTYQPIFPGSYACIVGNGGCTDTSDCVAYHPLGLENLTAQSWSVHPNPTTGVVIVDPMNTAGTLSVYDATGKLVLSEDISHTQPIDISLLERGVFIFKLQTETGMYVKRVVKE